MRRLISLLALCTLAACLDTYAPDGVLVTWEAPCDRAAHVVAQYIPDAPRGGDVMAQAVVACDVGRSASTPAPTTAWSSSSARSGPTADPSPRVQRDPLTRPARCTSSSTGSSSAPDAGAPSASLR